MSPKSSDMPTAHKGTVFIPLQFANIQDFTVAMSLNNTICIQIDLHFIAQGFGLIMQNTDLSVINRCCVPCGWSESRVCRLTPKFSESE